MAEAALPPADLLPVGRRANLPYRAVRLVALPLLRLCFRFKVEGRENIPLTGNYIVIANHLNWLDEFALLMLFPVEPRLHFLADPTGLVKRRFQWWLIRTTGGYVPVVRDRRGDTTLYQHVDRCLEVGGAVAMFPEGNYGPREGEMMPFKKVLRGQDPTSLTQLAFETIGKLLPPYSEPKGRQLLRRRLTHFF